MSEGERSFELLNGSISGFDDGGMTTPRSALHQLKAAGDPDALLKVVREAERGLEDLCSLAEVYGVALDCYGQPQSAQDYEYRDLCVKRMRALCRTNPTEARDFHNRLRTYTVGRADARMYEARAAMEERLGDQAKAVKMLQEGLKEGAQPAEVLHRVLGRLQPSSASPAPSVATPAMGMLGHTPQAQPPLQSSTALSGVSATLTSSSRGSLKSKLGRPRRILGLGSPMRTGPEEAEPAAADETTAESVGSSRGPSEGGAQSEGRSGSTDGPGAAEMHSPAERKVAESYTSVSMSMMRLTPIREGETPEAASSSGGGGAQGCRDSSLAVSPSIPSEILSPAPDPIVSEPVSPPEAAPATSPRVDPPAAPAAPAAHSSPAKRSSGQDRQSQKVVHVNGVPYQQVRMLGRGGSSKVYLVQGPSGEVYALKRVVAENAKQLEAFQNEVTLLQQLRDHEHVIQVVNSEIDHDKSRINIVMEAGDMDLGSFLRSEPSLSIPQIQDLWRQMLQAVQVIHSERIVHSDLKPGNFLLVGGRLKVIDFGIAKRISNDTTNIHRDASVGTLSYMAPETVKQGHLKIGRASDIWSLGIILYQMVYGQPPFAALEPWQRMLRLSDPGLAIHLPDVQGCSAATRDHLLEVLARCLQRDPRGRPSLVELLEHPFLQTRMEVEREVFEGAVGALMANVLRSVANALEPQAQPALEDPRAWRSLANSLWKHLAAAQSGGEAGCADQEDFDGLAHLEDRIKEMVRRPAIEDLSRARKPLRTLQAGGHLARAAQQKPQPGRGKENEGASWTNIQHQEAEAVKPGHVAETKEKLLHRFRTGPRI